MYPNSRRRVNIEDAFMDTFEGGQSIGRQSFVFIVVNTVQNILPLSNLVDTMATSNPITPAKGTETQSLLRLIQLVAQFNRLRLARVKHNSRILLIALS
jgi:hypothetical protein